MRGAAPDKTPDHTDQTAHALTADNRFVLAAVVGPIPASFVEALASHMPLASGLREFA